MRTIIHEIYSKVIGSDIFIVGGGSSLTNFDFSVLDGRNVIAINAAFHNFLREDVILYWGDASFGSTNEQKLLNHPSKYKFTSTIHADRAIANNKLGVAGSTPLKKTGDYGYDPNINNVKGNNSGTQALNFALNMSPSRILLLGFDMKHIGSKTHYHNHHDIPTASSTYPELFIPSMEKLAQESSHLSTRVINCSLDSSLKCFKVDRVENYL